MQLKSMVELISAKVRIDLVNVNKFPFWVNVHPGHTCDPGTNVKPVGIVSVIMRLCASEVLDCVCVTNKVYVNSSPTAKLVLLGVFII